MGKRKVPDLHAKLSYLLIIHKSAIGGKAGDYMSTSFSNGRFFYHMKVRDYKNSDILANFTTDGLIWLVRRLFR